jgi:Holliday junction resolvase RusA-like endonuclease
MICVFTVLGPPKGKERPRFNPRTKRAITPKATREYEAAIANVANLYLGRDWPKDRRYRLRVGFTGRRCDPDNVLKAVADGLEGVAYANDRQVDECSAYRLNEQKPPRTEIRLEVIP